jgi:hypothetical protein
MATVDELVIRIKADATQLERELKRVTSATEQQAGKMSTALGGLKGQFAALMPALTVGALVAFGKNAIDAAGHIQDMADRIGFAANTLSALEIPLRTSGSSLDEFAASINRMNNMVGEAAKGLNQEAVKAFDQLGLSVRKLQQMSPEEQFYAISQAIMSLDSQAQITESGMNIFGRSFAAMLPLLKQYEGDMREAAKASSDLLEGISPESIKRVDEFGDSLEGAGVKARNAFIEAFAAVLKFTDFVGENLPDGYERNAKINAQFGRDAYGRRLPQYGPDMPTDKAFTNYDEAFGPPAQSNRSDARGSNAGLLKRQADPVGDYLRKLQQQNDQLALPQPERAGQQAVDELRNAAIKEGISLTRQQIDLARELAVANYEAQNPDAIEEYVERLEQERQIMEAGATDREGMRAYFELTNQLRRDGIVISEEEKQKIIDLTGANDQLRKSIEEGERQTKQWNQEMKSGLTDIILHFDSAGDAAGRFFDTIASRILDKHISGPLADFLVGGEGGGGLLGDMFSGLGFASGGRPPVGKYSVVGEDGPELFRPDTAGTIIPNGASMGGGGISFTQIIQVSPGVPELVRSEIVRAAPSIAAAAKALVVRGAESGGRDSQIFGKRN